MALRYVRGHHHRLPADAGVVGYCECGCGERPQLATKTDALRGERKGYPRRFVKGHNSRKGAADYVEDENGCWVWQRSIARTGYGMVKRVGGPTTNLAHRWYYENERGPVPPGMHLDHLCRNRACVNPGHLEVVTRRVNTRRGANAILTEAQVAEIRAHLPGVERYGKRALAAKYGVCEGTIKDIRRGRTWKDPTVPT